MGFQLFKKNLSLLSFGGVLTGAESGIQPTLNLEMGYSSREIATCQALS